MGHIKLLDSNILKFYFTYTVSTWFNMAHCIAMTNEYSTVVTYLIKISSGRTRFKIG